MTASLDLPAGPVTYQQLRTLGVTDKRIARLVADGVLRRPLRGVYLPTASPDSHAVRAACVALVVSDSHVAVDRTAAWLHGIDVLTYAEHELPPPVETCAVRGSHPTERCDVRGRSRDLAPRDIATVAGVRVTTPLRTALDLGCHLRRRDAFAALCGFAREHGVTAEVLVRELPRYRRRRGVIQLRHLAGLVDPRVESAREAWTLLEIVDAGLPVPEPQYWVEVDGEPIYRLDFAYPRSRVCVEYDGWDAHERTDEQRAHDQRRRAWLRDEGWTVIVVRRGDFTGADLDRWLGELRQALRSGYSNRRW